MAKLVQGLPEIMTTKEQSIQACIKLADMYTMRLIEEEELRSMLNTWITNCPSVLLDSNKRTLDSVVARRIGKKRTVVITAALNNLFA